METDQRRAELYIQDHPQADVYAQSELTKAQEVSRFLVVEQDRLVHVVSFFHVSQFSYFEWLRNPLITLVDQGAF